MRRYRPTIFLSHVSCANVGDFASALVSGRLPRLGRRFVAKAALEPAKAKTWQPVEGELGEDLEASSEEALLYTLALFWCTWKKVESVS